MGLLSQVTGYDWCGVYRLDGGELVLDEYVGEPTDHVRIPVGVGVCGTAVATGRNQVVEDVRALENYLSCSAKTRSEIVVLVRHGGEVLGQIDVDGHEAGRFGPEDESGLEALAGLLASKWH
jgi:GAF domain-containing protein